MTESDIADVIAGFARRAGYAKQLDFDGVEIHGAHGYVIDQFFWDGTNQRDDHTAARWKRALFFRGDYSGRTWRGRTRFSCVVALLAMEAAGFRRQGGSRPRRTGALSCTACGCPCRLFHCSTRRFSEPEFPGTGSDLNLAGWTKKLSGKPTITVDSVSLNEDFITANRAKGTETAGIEALLEMLSRGHFDLVAIGRALMVNPDWPDKVRTGKFDQLKAYTPEALATLD